MKHILLVRPDKAGDAIKSLRALRLARKKLPNAHFSVLCSFHNASLFAFEPGIRSFTLPPNWESLSDLELQKALAAFPFTRNGQPVDEAISLLSDLFPSVSRLMQFLPALKKTYLPKQDSLSEEKKIAGILSNALNLDLISELSQVSRQPALCQSDFEEARRIIAKTGRRRLAYCPFAGTEQRTQSDKRWRNFIRLTRRMAKNCDAYVFGSPKEHARLEKLCTDIPHLKVVFPSSFRALAAYLKEMDGVIAVDSGPLHLAQSLEVPSLGILSGGDFMRWFANPSPKDTLIPRGWVSRYPSLLEMALAFRKWGSLNRFVGA